MRINSKYIYSLLGVSLALTACSSEELTSPAGNDSETMHVTLTVNRPSDKTRTTLTETENGRALASVWDEGDQLVVINSANQKVGELTLESGERTATGVFSGELSGVVADATYTVCYLGASNDGNAPYASVKVDNGVATVVNALASAEGCKVTGAFADLRRADYMKESVKLTVTGDKAYASEDVTLAPQNAMVHFSLADVPATLDENVSLTMTYGNDTDSYSYKVTSIASDIYLPIIPGYTTYTFSLSNGDKVYEATVSSDAALEAGLYYAATDAITGNGTGINVPLEEVGTENPEPNPGVGPVIEFNSKRWRFTRGNLKYTLSTDIWTILDTQAAYVNAGGRGLGEATKSKLGQTDDEIGLFAWGATGVEDAQKPWTIRFNEYEQSVTGDYWPSTNGTSKNRTISNLLDETLGYVYDFGHAYMSKGRSSSDDREYITPPQAAFEALFNSCFVQGATLKKMGENGADVQGLLCIPGTYTLAEAKDFINSVDGATCLTTMPELKHNNTGNTLSYKNITITDYEALKRLNDAVFFPAASKRNLSSGQIYDSNGSGYYWQATGSSSGTNAFDLFFNGNSGGFFYKGTSTSASFGRFNQMAIRLLVEVKEGE